MHKEEAKIKYITRTDIPNLTILTQDTNLYFATFLC